MIINIRITYLISQCWLTSASLKWEVRSGSALFLVLTIWQLRVYLNFQYFLVNININSKSFSQTIFQPYHVNWSINQSLYHVNHSVNLLIDWSIVDQSINQSMSFYNNIWINTSQEQLMNCILVHRTHNIYTETEGNPLTTA